MRTPFPPIVIAAALVAVLLSGCGEPASSASGPTPRASVVHSPHPSPSKTARPHPAGVSPADMPTPGLTPGVALHVTVAQVCITGYAASVRNVPGSEKEAVYARYGVAHVPYQHEVDHLISLEIGGSNDIRNLWPEPYAGRWGARTKDVLENKLHDLVCSRRLSLATAQRQEATNWVAAYLRYVGGESPPSESGGSSTGGYYASSYSTASTIYCADDPAWKELSKTYLVHFATFAGARARFPSYHLHRPC
jgi:hypothetical protein